MDCQAHTTATKVSQAAAPSTSQFLQRIKAATHASYSSKDRERVCLSSEYLETGPPEEPQKTSALLWGLLANAGDWLNDELAPGDSACGSEGSDSELFTDDEDDELGPSCFWADEPEDLVQPGLLVSAGLDRVIVSSVAVGGGHAIFVTTCSRAFGVGCNNRGQLGLGHREMTYQPEPLPDLRDELGLGSVDSSDDFCFLASACGREHSLFLAIPRGKSRGKRVFACGAGDVLGLKDCACDQDWPQVVVLPGEVTALAVRGRENCCAVDERSDSSESMCHLIYVWGHTHCFTCPDYLKLPCPIFKMPNAVRQLALGTSFGLALDVEGCVYAWGDDSYGELGGAASREATMAARDRLWQVSLHSRDKHDLLNDLKNIPTPGRVSLPRRPDVPHDGFRVRQTFSTDNRRAQNILADSGSYPIPMAPQGLDTHCAHRIAEIACGERHSLMLNEEGMLFSFGANFAGQCGVADELEGHRMSVSTIRFIPIKCVPSDKESRKYVYGARVFAGRWHSAMITREDRLYMWGHPANQKLGHVGFNHDGTEAGESHSSKARPPGVAVRSALRDSVRQPRLVHALLHRRIQAVGLGDECTVVVSGNGGLGSKDLRVETEDKLSPLPGDLHIAKTKSGRKVSFGRISTMDIPGRENDELPNLDALEAGMRKTFSFGDSGAWDDTSEQHKDSDITGIAEDLHSRVSL